MTTWVNWQSWTWFVVGEDLAYGGLVRELDFPNRRITYDRETGNPYFENPHPNWTPEARAYDYETIEAAFDRVWVNPKKTNVLDHDERAAIDMRKMPSFFVELVDVDPRDYFDGDVVVMSTYAPHLLRLALPEDARRTRDEPVPKPPDVGEPLEQFRQLHRDIDEGLVALGEAVPRSIWLLGAVDDLGAAWSELNAWVSVDVRSRLRSALAEGSVVDEGDSMSIAVQRVASWADERGILSQDPAYRFMSQPPVDILEFVRRNMGQALPDPGMSWWRLAMDAVSNSFESEDPRTWLTIGIQVSEWLASQKPDPDASRYMGDAMYARGRRLRLPGTSPIDRDDDLHVILEWFFRNESMAPAEAAICRRDWYTQSRADGKKQYEVWRKLGVFKMLDESGELLPERIKQWLAIYPHLR